jgi:hypothetical protein
MKRFDKWFHNAEWWHFWNPGSGVSCGAIAGLLLSVIFLGAFR